MEGGHAGALGVPAVSPVVARESASNGGNARTPHPAMEELTVGARGSERKTVTWGPVFPVIS